MRQFLANGTALLTLVAAPAYAGDKPLIGPIPDWVQPAPTSALEDVPQSGNVVPLFDEQAFIDGDLVTTYIDTAKAITSPSVLNKSGTVSFSWRPKHGDLTFHRISIIRDGENIDALGDADGFTVLQREARLESKIVDGRLTAVKHLEDLRVGDTLRVTVSISERDPVLDGNVQDALLLIPAPASIRFGRLRMVWPQDREITWKVLAPDVSASPKSIPGHLNELEISMPIAKFPEMPKNYPSRFKARPLVVFSSFKSWSEVAKVNAPHYRVEGLIAPGSDLAGVVDAIAARSSDPVQRMADALRIVQDEVRYQLIALGSGNYLPQSPTETWSKRYGDCKAKSMLLLALLDRLGIEAEPVLANLKRGDAVSEMPPGLFAFDHVFVRARIGEEDFWLDGTQLGSRLADIRDIPRYGKVLPVFANDAALLDLPRRANSRSANDIDLAYDMSAGPHLPAPFTLKIRYAGTWAERYRIKPGSDFDGRLEKHAKNVAESWTSSETIGRPQASYDSEEAVWTMTVEGVSYPDWEFEDGHHELPVEPLLGISIDAKRGKSAWRDIPALIERPWTAHSRMSIRLPDVGSDISKAIVIDGDETASLSLPAVEWNRTFSHGKGSFVEDIVSRESGHEIPASELSAVVRQVRGKTNRTARIIMPDSYPRRWHDVKRMGSSKALARVRKVFDQRIKDKPEEAQRVSDRGWFAARLFDWKSAESYYSKAIALDPSAARYVTRGQTRELRGDFAGALKDAQQAYDLESGNEAARSLLATALAEEGRVDEGLDLLDIDPDVTTDSGLSEFLLRLLVLEAGGRHDEVGEILDVALERRASIAALQNYRCWHKGLHNKDLDGALADCNRSIELSSEPAGALDSRAMVHYRAGRLQEAHLDLQKALALSPEQASSLYMLGFVENQLGNSDVGSAQISAARQINPGIDSFFGRYGIAP
ncbi:MAG: DUF3857 domain-containing protein [Novosphingobium sp.]|nr:DUF3857 domain-containing protein [Novosphingobium sp.]